MVNRHQQTKMNLDLYHEQIARNTDKSIVLVITTTRQVFLPNNFVLNNLFYKRIDMVLDMTNINQFVQKILMKSQKRDFVQMIKSKPFNAFWLHDIYYNNSVQQFKLPNQSFNKQKVTGKKSYLLIQYDVPKIVLQFGIFRFKLIDTLFLKCV